jgi:Protein of unknown function (DUF3017)
VAHLRAVPDPDDDPGEDPGIEAVAEPGTDGDHLALERVDPAAAVAPGEDDAPESPAEVSRPADEEESRRYPSTIGGAFYLSILVAAGTALVIAARSDWRLGIQVLGGSLIVAALLRLVLADRDAGMLAVRNRFVDALLLGATGAALITLATSIPGLPVT